MKCRNYYFWALRIYPRLAAHIYEDSLLVVHLNQQMSHMQLLKLQALKCAKATIGNMEDYRSVMPTNLYGPGDNYHPENGHVVPALIRRFHEAKLNKS